LVDEEEPTSGSLTLTASLAPSEDPEKVVQAVKNVLGDCDFEITRETQELRARSGDMRCLRKIHDQLRDRRVRDAARRFLVKKREGDMLSLLLNRQAAHAGVVVLCANPEESPLGPLILRMTSSDPDQLVDWLTAH
jgi:predicted RNA binding protein with dsRBD fold (UPF0201 family)